MTTHPMIHLLLLGVLVPGLTSAMPPGPPPPAPVSQALDRNHDHELSSREIRNAPKALLKLDEDRDNALSMEELRPEPPREERRRNRDEEGQDPPPGPPPSRLLQALDTDADGTLSAAEIAAAPEALLKLDADEDGELSTEEAGLGRPSGPNPGGPGGPPPGGPRR